MLALPVKIIHTKSDALVALFKLDRAHFRADVPAARTQVGTGLGRFTTDDSYRLCDCGKPVIQRRMKQSISDLSWRLVRFERRIGVADSRGSRKPQPRSQSTHETWNLKMLVQFAQFATTQSVKKCAVCALECAVSNSNCMKEKFKKHKRESLERCLQLW